MIEKILEEINKCQQFEEYPTNKPCVRIEDVEKILLSYLYEEMAGEKATNVEDKCPEVKKAVRYVDDLGRIALPNEIRTRMQVYDGMPLEISMEGDSVVLRKYAPYMDVVGLIGSLDLAVNAEEAGLISKDMEKVKKHVEKLKVLFGL